MSKAKSIKIKSEPICSSGNSSNDSDNDIPASAAPMRPPPSRRSFQKTSNEHNAPESPVAAKRVHIPTRYEKSLATYLDKRPHIKVLSANRNPTALAKPKLSDDEEVWLVQCPKNVPIENLIDKTLKLNGRRHVLSDDTTSKSYEYYADKAAAVADDENDHFYTAICKSEQNDCHQAFSFRSAGVIRFKEELAAADAGGIVDLVGPQRVPYPTELKVRHPLLGVHFADRTKLDKRVRRALQRAVQASAIAKAELVVKKEEPSTIRRRRSIEQAVKVEQEFDDILGLSGGGGDDNVKTVKSTSPRKAKKRSRTAEVLSPGEEEETPRKKHKSKRVKVEEATIDGGGGGGEDEVADLDWMTKI